MNNKIQNDGFVLRKPLSKKYKVILFISLLAIIISSILISKTDAKLWHLWHQFNDADHHGLELSNYKVAIEAKRLKDYKNISGIAFNHDTGSLFAVLNGPNIIVELSKEGVPLREIQVQGADDLEDITYIENDYYVVADERESRLWLLHIKADTQEISVEHARVLQLGMNERGNKNFEGVSWDRINHRLIVVKERDPRYVISVSGLYHADVRKRDKFEINSMKQFDLAIQLALRDLSSVSYHSESGHLFLLSDESKLLKQFEEGGKTLDSLALWKGFHGLHESIPQAEGVAIDDEGNIYIVSEPNLFYVFKPKQPLIARFMND